MTKVTAVAISFVETDFDFGLFGTFRFEMLAGNEAEGVDVSGGGGGDEASGKNGWSSVEGEVVVVLGVKGTPDDGDVGGGAGGESNGKNGWCNVRRYCTTFTLSSAGAPDVVKIKIKKRMMRVFIVGVNV